jgi:hypothetical protein
MRWTLLFSYLYCWWRKRVSEKWYTLPKSSSNNKAIAEIKSSRLQSWALFLLHCVQEPLRGRKLNSWRLRVSGFIRLLAVWRKNNSMKPPALRKKDTWEWNAGTEWTVQVHQVLIHLCNFAEVLIGIKQENLIMAKKGRNFGSMIACILCLTLGCTPESDAKILQKALKRSKTNGQDLE